MTTGELIRYHRKRVGLTQKQLGERAGIAEPTIRRYELGKLKPKYETIEKLHTRFV
ncbi:MAG: helix-turn-helix domain-containing protein [Coprococcus phoceensis]